MLKKMQSTLIKSLTSHISQSQREVTILFTDIEASTRYWGNRGNVAGRLMVDRHNRILLPIIRQFRGRVVKTIGDSVMAMFSQPVAAVDAAIAIQQALQRAREEDREFDVHVRIGLHIGDAVVEHNDVYGDVVNVAARIEAEAKRDEILISGRLARRLDKEHHRSSKHGSFTPRGKHRRIALYLCHWQEHEELLARIRLNPLSRLGQRQQLEVAGYLLVLLISIYLFYHHYLRYLLADHEVLALLLLNPGTMLWRYWYLTLLLTIGIALLLWRSARIDVIPSRGFKLLKGAASGTLFFALLQGLAMLIPLHDIPGLGSPLVETHHLFVELEQDETPIHAEPSTVAEVVRRDDAGTLLLLADVRRVKETVWNKVLLEEGQYGWVMRIRPADIGITEQRISRAAKFSLHYTDLLLLLLTLPAIFWGYRSFHIRPQ